MPLAWDSVKLSLFFKGNWFNLKVTNTEVSVKITSKIRRKVTLKIFDVTHRVAVGKLAVFHTGEPPSKLSLAERYY
jgi:trehalose/maltose hydrolase-like predicted phosphorylase